MKGISSWATTQAVAETKCPRCKSEPGTACVTPNARRCSYIHGERTTAYRKSIGPEEFRKRHVVVD